MRHLFVKTKAVIQAIGGLQAVQGRSDGIPSILLLIAMRGAGKTRLALYLLAHDVNIIYLRAKAAYENRVGWFLRDIARELGFAPSRMIEEVYGQIIGSLQERSRVIIIDEIGRLANSGRLLEVTKDIHDQVGVPFVFLGEVGSDRLLSRFPSILDRVTQIVTFAPFDRDDVALIAKTLLEVEIDDDGITSLFESVERRFRPMIITLNRVERWARDMGIETITSEHVRAVLDGRGRLIKRSTVTKPTKAISAA